MSIVRREFLMTGVGLASGLLLTMPGAAASRTNFKAIAFDAFAIFDPRPVAALCETLFPGRGSELVNTWRIRQFEYTWLRIVSNHYADFARVTDDALTFAAKTLELEIAAEKRQQLRNAYFELKTWSDAIPALTKLKEIGISLAFLSNFTANMLDSCIKFSGLDGLFDQVLSTDSAHTYKPDARAYQLGLDALKLQREEILFVAFAGWDAAGAKLFGYPTFWINRLGVPPEELGTLPDATGETLSDLLTFVS
jgi:2-haloacid dehalogenase